MSLLERFRKDSKFASDGRFTLDEKRARTKMARFQLTKLEEFILLVVQAVVAAKCQGVRIDLKADDKTGHVQVFLQATGTTLESQRLESLDDYFFRKDLPSAPYNLLGVALNAVEASCTGPPSLTQSDAGDTTLELTLSRSLPNLEAVVRERVLHCPCSVVLNGVELPQRSLQNSFEVKLFEGSSGWLYLVRYGVLVERCRVEDDPAFRSPVFRAAVENPEFQMDASFSHVVRDQAYLDAVVKARNAANGLVAELARQSDPKDHGRLLDWLVQLNQEPAASALRSARLFPVADGDHLCCAGELNKCLMETKQVLTSERRLNLVIGQPVVLLEDPLIRSTLKKLFPGRGLLQDADPIYRRKLQAQQNRVRWERSPRLTELPPGSYMGRLRTDGPYWQAELGFLKGSSDRAIDTLFQGKLLGTDTLSGDLPPGAQVVVNFDQVKVDELWTRPVGRRYNSALREIRQKLHSLFDSLPGLPREDLYPELEEYLLAKVSIRTDRTPKIVEETPLFPTFLEGQWLSLKQLQAHPKVYFGPSPDFQSEDFPKHVIPKPYLRYNPDYPRILQSRLGLKNVIDFSERLAHYRRVDHQLRYPLPAVLGIGGFQVTEKYCKDGVQGEFALSNRRGTKSRITLHYRGVLMEDMTINHNLVFEGHAILDSPRFMPDKDWNGLLPDAHYRSVLKLCREKFRALEVELLDHDKTLDQDRVRLLIAYPDLAQKFINLPLFPNHRQSESYSLMDVHKELEQNGRVLVGDSSLDAAGKKVFRQFEREPWSLLKKVFGDKIVAEPAHKVLAKEKRLESFHNQEVVSEIKLQGDFFIKVASEVGRGELGLVRTDGLSSGHLDCYIEGRLAEVKLAVLPEHCMAAVEHPNFAHNEDFSEVVVPKHIVGDLKKQYTREMVKLLGSVDRRARSIALEYVADVSVVDRLESQVMSHPFVRLYGGGVATLETLEASHAKSFPYVSPDFEVEVPVSKPILQHSTHEMGLLARITLGCRGIRNVEKELLQDFEDSEYLRGLPRTVPKSLKPLTFRSATLNATIAISEATSLVALDREGNTLGTVYWGGFPVVGVVGGLVAKARKQGEMPQGAFDSQSLQEFTEWVHELYLDWCKSLSQERLTEEKRNKALLLLKRTERYLGSDPSETRAQISQVLWDLPLFLRVDDSWTSGTALSVQLSDSGQSIMLAQSTWRTPGDALLLEEGSPELALLRSVLGKTSLQWYEHPPLIDTEQIKESVKRLAGWGMTPLRSLRTSKALKSLQTGFSGALEKLTSTLTRDNDGEEPAERERKAGPPSQAQREQKLLRELHSDLGNLLGRKAVKSADRLFGATDFGSWVLGPPVYRSRTTGRHRFNRLHPSIRWLLSEEGPSRNRRVASSLLLVAWVGLVNIASEPLTDQHEERFLVNLLERLEQTFR
jgi:hypothetical protein